MVFTNEDYLPSYDELTVPEITMSAAPLRASAQQFGKYCDKQCKVKQSSHSISSHSSLESDVSDSVSLLSFLSLDSL